jgi:transposase
MEKSFRAWEPEQSRLFPPSVLDLVPEGHASHVVREIVRQELDLSAIYASYVEVRGGPPYHPAMMVALLLYGYAQGIRSSRRLARACEERVDFMAVTGMQRPDHDTINEFRRRHARPLEALFAQVLTLCQKAGLVSLGHVSLDGTKIRANASKHKAMSYGRMKKSQEELRAEVRKYLEESAAIDDAEDAELGKGRRGDEQPEWVKNKQERLARIRAAKAELEAEARQKAQEEAKRQSERPPSAPGPRPAPPSPTPDDAAQRNFTDPESRVMRAKGTFEQSYNAHAAVDADRQVIVACEVTNQQNDGPTLVPMLAQVQENCGRRPREVSGDSGYCSEANLAALEKARIRGYVATGRHAHGGAADPKARAVGPLTRAMRARLRRGGFRGRYRLRKTTVEPVFGQMKECRGFRQFLLRGLAKVRTEWSLACTAHNLLKLLNARLAGA